jgi:MoaA/NifB/PqqE/SkfB family radical SAM enzyme
VALEDPRTIWFNTGTLCNIECTHCYIESSPSNDRLAYLEPSDVKPYLDETVALGWPVREIGFTGGEPFLNPWMVSIAAECLGRGFEVLILTNAMRPMMRPSVRSGLLAMVGEFGSKLRIRVSLDHYHRERHDEERGEGSFDSAVTGMRWLCANGFKVSVAGRTMWDQQEFETRAGYAALFESEGFPVDAFDPHETLLFPEMDEELEVPEITSECWGLLDKSPSEVMCSHSRMIVKRKGASQPVVVACTLLPYDDRFELGRSLEDSAGPVHLNHPYCAQFCVLGGGACSL